MKGIPVECYSRVAGYFRPVTHWNKGKQSEFSDRIAYEIPNLEILHSSIVRK